MPRKSFLFFMLCLFSLIIAVPGYALVVSFDPFDATDHYAILLPSPEGSITTVQAKVVAPEQMPVGTGQLWALIRYKLPPGESSRSFYFAASQPVPIQGLSQTSATLISFDFSGEPIPSNAYYRTLMIYYQDEPSNEPLLIAEYNPEQLLLRPSGDTIQTYLTPQDTAVSGERILGPLTIIREREMPRTESIPFNVSDATGQFFLRVLNGTTEGTHRISSAVIKLNGHEVLRPSELNQQVSELNRQIALTPGENLLEVRLRSIPGSFIIVEIYRLEGNTCRAFGPHTFIRATGKPVTENVAFPLNPQMVGPFTLNLTNGETNGANRVDSASVTLNGQLVFDPSQFSEQVSSLSSSVSPQSNNTLGVELNGAPGDRLTIEMTGFDNTIPEVSIIEPMDGATFTSSPITVRGVVDDPSASVTVNGITAAVAQDGTFTVEGVTLQEGENTLAAIATDSCENQSQDMINVYLQTVPLGPEAFLCIEPFREQIPDPPLPGEECMQEGYGRYTGVVAGFVDETTVSVTLNGVVFQEGILVSENGPIMGGMWEGTFVWAFVNIPQIDGTHPFTLIAADSEGNQSSATVTFIRDTVPPVLNITSPSDGSIVNTPTVTITGTVDDPEATVHILIGGYYSAKATVADGVFTAYVDIVEGLNYLIVIASDPAGNGSYKRLYITLDTVPPLLNIANPAEGAVVNTANIGVSGTITDANIGTITVSVNNGPPQALTVAGANFSGTVSLSPGQNTLLFEATDQAGNSTTTTSNVFLDQLQPLVSITSPASGVQVSGVIPVQVDATDIQSGISGVSLFVDGELYATTSSFPYTFELDTMVFAAGVHTITARAIDGAGNAAETSIDVDILRQIQLQILSPLDGAAVSLSPVLVRGRVINNLPEVGVVLNGVIAQVYGDDFAGEVYLQEGLNTITATATDGAGLEVNASISVTLMPEVSPLSLTAIPQSGIQPLEVTLETETFLTNPVANYQWDIDGNGTIDASGTTLTTITNTYPNPGMYYPKVIVTDTLGNIYEAATTITVLSATEMDALLRAKWEGMKQALGQGDIEKALSYIASGSKAMYRYNLELMASLLSTIVQDMGNITLIYIGDNVAEYEMTVTQDGQTFSFYVEFVRDEDGIWRIRFY